MNTLKHILFTAATIVCFSLTASAQKDGDKKTPPKDKPPIIVVEPKKPKDDKPKDGNKKPDSFVIYFRNEKNIG